MPVDGYDYLTEFYTICHEKVLNISLLVVAAGLNVEV